MQNVAMQIAQHNCGEFHKQMSQTTFKCAAYIPLIVIVLTYGFQGFTTWFN